MTLEDLRLLEDFAEDFVEDVRILLRI